MTEFMTWEFIGTFVGFAAAVALMTEFSKVFKFLGRVPTQLVSFAIAIVIMVVYKLATNDFKGVDIVLYILNSAGASLTANGAYDAVERIIGAVRGEGDDEIAV